LGVYGPAGGEWVMQGSHDGLLDLRSAVAVRRADKHLDLERGRLAPALSAADGLSQW
ncbi:MAG: hypothetical protein IIC61_08440, partial [Proteobacteria bacterium]|nr:hypothetical protein [Pseudomonadota bacterium]